MTTDSRPRRPGSVAPLLPGKTIPGATPAVVPVHSKAPTPPVRLILTITDEQSIVRLPAARLRRVLATASAAEGVARAEVGLALLDDRAIARLHGEWFADPTPTDVITFDLGDDGDGAGAGAGGAAPTGRSGRSAAGKATAAPGRRIAGEIAVSTQTAAAEAGRLGHETAAEVLLYVVHGLLHLTGWDDRTAAMRARMNARADELLAAAGEVPVYGRRRPARSRRRGGPAT